MYVCYRYICSVMISKWPKLPKSEMAGSGKRGTVRGTEV
jgi:hypothetical protein